MRARLGLGTWTTRGTVWPLISREIVAGTLYIFAPKNRIFGGKSDSFHLHRFRCSFLILSRLLFILEVNTEMHNKTKKRSYSFHLSFVWSMPDKTDKLNLQQADYLPSPNLEFTCFDHGNIFVLLTGALSPKRHVFHQFLHFTTPVPSLFLPFSIHSTCFVFSCLCVYQIECFRNGCSRERIFRVNIGNLKCWIRFSCALVVPPEFRVNWLFDWLR